MAKHISVSFETSDTEYLTRNNALSVATTWSLTPHGVHYKNERLSHLVPWSEIREIRLRYAPTRYVGNRYTCELQLGSGGTLWFSSHLYRSYLDFEDRSQAYTEFTRKLVTQVCTHNPNTRLTSGAGSLSYAVNVLALIFTGVMLSIATQLILALGLTWMIAIKLVVILYLLPRVLKWIRVNRGQSFRPDSIPSGVLP